MARRNAWASQAALQTLVRFSPEEFGLEELQRAAADQLRSSVGQAKGTSRAIVNAVGEARPEVAQIYDRAGLEQAGTASTLQGDTAGLGSVADSIKAGVSLEQTTGLRHLREAKADALTGLSERAVAAREGQKWGIQKAQQDFAKAITQVLQRKVALGREKGAFTAATAMELQRADLDRQQQAAIADARLSQSERNSLRSAGIDPNTGKPIPNGKLDPTADGKKKPRASTAQVAAAQDTIGTALTWARRLKDQGLDRGTVGQALLSGRDEQDIAVHDPQTGKPKYNADGTPVTRKRAGLPQIKQQRLLSVALDVAYKGYVSRENARFLHKRGLTLRDLGLPTFEEWRRKQPGVSRPGNAPAPGGARPT